MAKKKKSKKKFQGNRPTKKKKHHVQPSAAAMPAVQSDNIEVDDRSKDIVQTTEAIKPDRFAKKKSASNSSDGHDYVKADVHRSLVISGSILACLIVLWILFQHTGVGPAVYHLIKL